MERLYQQSPELYYSSQFSIIIMSVCPYKARAKVILGNLTFHALPWVLESISSLAQVQPFQQSDLRPQTSLLFFLQVAVTAYFFSMFGVTVYLISDSVISPRQSCPFSSHSLPSPGCQFR